jgi:hypothetical protein
MKDTLNVYWNLFVDWRIQVLEAKVAKLMSRLPNKINTGEKPVVEVKADYDWSARFNHWRWTRAKRKLVKWERYKLSLIYNQMRENADMLNQKRNSK